MNPIERREQVIAEILELTPKLNKTLADKTQLRILHSESAKLKIQVRDYHRERRRLQDMTYLKHLKDVMREYLPEEHYQALIKEASWRMRECNV